MSLKAYVLINTNIGKTTEVAKALSQMPEVQHLDIIMGPYDLIAEIETDSHETLSQVVLTRMQNIEAIRHTMTCPVVKMEEGA
ncbi:Lrp/AsnC family transcriptional regulator [Dissulfurirhabdus thermomarina]|uniref:Lrp/AsnC family transcriptional regulator n=1 Tax=Dissulfurirhabdus thermomarina TaxID=1765737 RepID=A0A6N9TPB0_DISTH|nr:Lrp/AsnC ligand binding domain-containing protein [Dissulfurirhabdus thermomarina]NDY43105.1 Lrp/AsnC family transcriptional regulator [Dissulfurirhabdus thermomarina]NMX24453.1 Lrp/AsnC family transcriptional regulator [Dissulfurirhabdus thermomarina]